jgi:hypothetical protein
MKKIIVSIMAIMTFMLAMAQVPQKMSYQAVIRNNSNELVTNKQVGMKISIIEGSINGSVIYTETRFPVTNANGLVSIEIGGESGFESIDWANGPYFIKTETDPTGGSAFSISNTCQLLSVPYAMYAGKSGDSYWLRSDDNINFLDGKVGIGTSTPEHKLEIRASDTDEDWVGITIGSFDGAHKLTLFGGRENDPNPYIFWKHGDPLRFTTDQNGWSEKMRITSDGRLGIGTAHPQGKLHVVGDSSLQVIFSPAEGANSLTSGLMLRATFGEGITDHGPRNLGLIKAGFYGGAWDKAALTFHVAGGDCFTDGDTDPCERMRITGDGNVGIGIESPAEKLEVDGNINIHGYHIINLADPVNEQDAATKAYVDASGVQSETDPVFSSSPASGITGSHITNWNNAFGWDNHAGLYRPVSWLPSWVDVTEKPTTFPPAAHTHGNITSEGKIGSTAGRIITTGSGGTLQATAGTAAGQMLYWNGNSWINVAPGISGQVLTLVNGVPTWLATVPGAPTIGTATAGNAQATVTFTAPVSNGGSPITGYTVTSSPGGITRTGSASPITVTGLTNGTTYTFTVTATNANGTGPASAVSNSVTLSTVPGAPTIGTATAGNAQATVTFTAPVSNGGSPITGYTVTSSPGGITRTGSASPITVAGLTNLTTYTFTVTATNANGTGPASAPSNSVIPGTVTNPATGKIWMDRNLGATRVATSSTDANSYGHLYQWGRGSDGHQVRTSGTTTALSSSNTPGHGNFILAPNSPYDWRSPQNDNLWQGLSGTNNPCPSGYRLPTEAEWNAERLSWSSNNSAGAFASPLKLPVAGGRLGSNGSLGSVGSYGYYWSSTVDGSGSRGLYFGSTGAGMYYGSRAGGDSVRCLKD